LVSGSEDHDARIWDLADRRLLRILKGHTNRIYEVAFNPDGTQVVSCSREGTVRFWDAASGTEIRRLTGHTGWVTSISFNPDGTRLASAGDDGTVRLWDTSSGTELRVLRDHTGWVHSVAFSPDGTRLLSGGMDGTVRLADGRSWTPSQAEAEEARCLVEGFLARPLLVAEAQRLIREHHGISDAVRAQALELANRSRDEAERFSGAAREVVRHPRASKPLHELAGGWAQMAVTLKLGNGPSLTTLGIAHYRLGHDAAALEVLAQAEAANQANEPELLADLAFQALALHRIGRIPEAKARLDILRVRMEKPPGSWNAEATGYLAEAEQAISQSPR
jgi:predicted NACHT family NTPase